MKEGKEQDLVIIVLGKKRKEKKGIKENQISKFRLFNIPQFLGPRFQDNPESTEVEFINDFICWKSQFAKSRYQKDN